MSKNQTFAVVMCAVLGLSFSACSNEQSTTTTTKHTSTTASPKDDILIQDMDSTVRPGDDFFEYANGGWIKRNSIPKEENSWGIGYLVNKELYDRKRKINEEAVKKGDRKPVEQQVADFWTTGMDSASVESAGITPLKDELDRIAAAKTKPDIMTAAAHLHSIGVGVFFDEGAQQDLKNSEVYAYYLSQGGLGLPNRDYYFNTDARTTKIRTAYPVFISKMIRLMGEADTVNAMKRATAVLKLETTLAAASRKLADLRDPYKNYNKMGAAQLKSLSPSVDWQATMRGIGVPQMDSVVIGQPEFYKALDKIITATPVNVLQDYMSFHTVRAFSPYLSRAFNETNFDFYSRTIGGIEEQKPRWKRVLDAEEGAIGEEVGQLFVKEYFSERAKGRYNDMVEKIRDAFSARIKKLDWMSDSTKATAQRKLSSMTKKVGYPDKWKDFSGMKIGRASYAQNMIESRRWWNNYQLAKIGKPVDRTEWDMTPQTYNAYYNPSNNEIVLPAGQLTVPGYMDEDLDDALVYGYTAASTIGHEITHGFDDEGRQYDEKGNLHSWWTKNDEEQFKKRSAVLVKQFNGMVAVDTMHINGAASLGENLADLGGLLLGVDAFKQTAAYKKGEKINGLTPMQRFFQGYTLGWLYTIRPERLASQVMTDVHAPAKFRVNGPLPNVPAFYEAYGIKPGDKMYLADSLRVKLW